MDMEADSLHHYAEKVCLLQFTVAPADAPQVTADFLVDPLAGLDLKPLFAVLADKPLVLHGSDYDLRMLRAGYDFAPAQLFDTMLAARLAGHPALGLDALVKRYIGQTLDHGQQKADWSQRPLPPRMVAYAVNDTRYLPVIVRELRKELAALGRAEWHRQQCDQLIRVAGAPAAAEEAEPWRIKGSSNLDPRALAILRELWRWRDEEARQWNRPAFMVCGGRQLLDWAAWGSAHPQAGVAHVPNRPSHWRSRRAKSFEEAFQRAWNLPPSEWPALPPRPRRVRHDPGFLTRRDRLRAARDAKAREIGLEPSLVATNMHLIAVAARNPRRIEDFDGLERWLPWQTELLGESFLKALKDG